MIEDSFLSIEIVCLSISFAFLKSDLSFGLVRPRLDKRETEEGSPSSEDSDFTMVVS